MNGNVGVGNSGFFESEAEPSLLLRALPGVNERDARNADGMLRDGNIRIGGFHSDTELSGSLIQLRFYIARISRGRNDERARVVSFSAGLK